MILLDEGRQSTSQDQIVMADVSYRSVDDYWDEDPTEELQILPGRVMVSDDDTQTADPICAANQEFEDRHLDAEIREANDRVSELSSELRSRTEMMQSIQRELDRLRDFSEFLEKEVESGKGAVSEVTDELVSVRAQQNDVSEQLRRREQQVTVLRDKLAKKDAFIEELARRMDIADFSDGQEKLGPQQVSGDLQSEHDDASVHAACQSAQAQPNRLRMIVARHDNKTAMYPVLAGGSSIGTSPDNDVQLEDAFVSYRHAMITETSAGCLLKDLDSSNGTWINRRRIKWQVLRHGDLIDFGPLRFEFIDKPVEIQNAQTEDEVA
jgi:archaellum component FlaC